MVQAIVTGADGFIGSNLLKHLTRCGVEVWALIIKDSPTRYRIATLKNVHIIECDYDNLDIYVSQVPHNADAFYHLAWQGVAPEERNSVERQMINISLSLRVLQFSRMISCKRFILPGSTMEYLYYGKPINKLAVPTPHNAYGAAKLSARFLCSAMAKSLDQTFIYTVLTGVYGGDRQDNNVISYTIKMLLQGERPQLTNLRQLWDYVHINDVTEALYCIGKSGKDNAFYTIGHGDNWPLYNYIYKIRDLIDPSLPLGLGEIPYMTEELPSSCVDLTCIYQDTGFVPKISFEEGIIEVIEQIRRNILK